MQEMNKSSPRRSNYSFWWHHDAGYHCVVPTNCIVKNDGTLVMDAGLAKAVAEEYPTIASSFGRIISLKGQYVDVVTETKHSGTISEFIGRFIMFPIKHSWRDNSTPLMIEQSTKQLLELVDKLKIKQSTKQLLELVDKLKINNIFVPKVGCGLGGLSWESVVEPILVNLLDERFVIAK